MSLHLRVGQDPDLAAIEAAELAYMQAVEPEHVTRWVSALPRNRQLWRANLERTTVLEIDAALAGYVMWTLSETDATLVTINVLPDYRRQGLGSRLLRVFIEQASTNDRRTLRLGVHRDNPAQRLYLDAGFTRSGVDGEYVLMYRSAENSAGSRW